ncbi:MAG: 3-deoxy-D-manno-octulosonic acid kinase [Pusillimonas sp.]
MPALPSSSSLTSPSWLDLPVDGGRVRLAGRLSAQVNHENLARWFDPAFDPLQAVPVQVGGRQAAWFVQGPWESGVLRHYRRGGLVARISRQHYVWQGGERTRSFAEFALLDRMVRQGLPVPEPLGAAWWRVGMVYRAAIVVARIQGATTLARSLDCADPVRVAAAILHMHDADVWHADLNAFNILLDPADRVWLIDFDRGCVRRMTAALRQANLARLHRSLAKLGASGQSFAQALGVAYRQLSAA